MRVRRMSTARKISPLEPSLQGSKIFEEKKPQNKPQRLSHHLDEEGLSFRN